MAASTASRVAGRTASGSLTTRETVFSETPASRATSTIEGPLFALLAIRTLSHNFKQNRSPWE